MGSRTKLHAKPPPLLESLLRHLIFNNLNRMEPQLRAKILEREQEAKDKHTGTGFQFLESLYKPPVFAALQHITGRSTYVLETLDLGACRRIRNRVAHGNPVTADEARLLLSTAEHFLAYLGVDVESTWGGDDEAVPLHFSNADECLHLLLRRIWELPFLQIGSIWQYGRPYYWPLRTPRFNLYTSRTFSNLIITPQTSRAISSGAGVYGADGHFYSYIPWGEYYIAESTPDRGKGDRLNQEGLKAKCLLIDLPAEQSDGVSKIIIPCIEILRFYYGNSTQMIQHIIWGKIDEANDGVYHPSPYFTYFDKDSGTHYLMLGRSIPDVDAPVVARLAFSPYAGAQAQLIHDRRFSAKEFVEHSTPWDYSPVVFPPFEEATNLSVQGKIIDSVGGKAFLVFYLSKCTSDFPFDRLRPSRLNDGRTGIIEDPEGLCAWADRSKASSVNRASNSQSSIQTGVEPSNLLAPFEVTLDSERFPCLKYKDIEKPIKYESRYKSSHRKLSADEEQHLSTSPGSYRISKIRRLYISHDLLQKAVKLAERAKLLADFERFMEVIENIKILNNEDLLKNKPGVSKLEILTESLDLPLTKLSIDRQWSYIDFNEKRRRLVILARIRSAKKTFYLFDIERREGNSTDEYPMLLIDSSSIERIDEDDIQSLLKYYAKNKGRWFSGNWEWSHLNRKKFKHLRDDASRAAKRIYTYLLGLTK